MAAIRNIVGGVKTLVLCDESGHHKISFFVPHPGDVAHPGSGLAQDLLRLATEVI